MVMNTALLVIDVQLVNFLEPYPVHEGSKQLERVKGARGFGFGIEL